MDVTPIEGMLNELSEEIGVQWDRAITIDDAAACYGWIPRDDGHFDFVTFQFGPMQNDLGMWASWITSSEKYSEHIMKKAQDWFYTFGPEDHAHAACQPMADVFPGIKVLVPWQQ